MEEKEEKKTEEVISENKAESPSEEVKQVPSNNEDLLLRMGNLEEQVNKLIDSLVKLTTPSNKEEDKEIIEEKGIY